MLDEKYHEEASSLLAQVAAGDAAAEDALIRLLYDRLRRVAAAKLSRERPGCTFQPTALVHEAFLRLRQELTAGTFVDSEHFLRTMFRAMARILIDRGRSRRTSRSSTVEDTALDAIELPEELKGLELEELETAIIELDTRHPEVAQCVRRYFLFEDSTHDSTANALSLTVDQVRQRITRGIAWLRNRLGEDE